MNLDFNLIGIKACFISSLYPYMVYILDKYKQKNTWVLFLFIISIFFAISLESRALMFTIIFSNYLLSANTIKIRIYWLLLIVGILLFLKWHSFLGRVFIWKVIISNFLSVPIFGFGINTFKEKYSVWQIEYFDKNQEWSVYHTLADASFSGYNELLTYYVEIGFFGPLLILALLFFNILVFKKCKMQIQRVAATSYFNIFFFSLVSYSLHNYLIIYVAIISQIVIIFISHAKYKRVILVSSISTIVLFGSYFYKYLDAKANWAFAQSIPIQYIEEKKYEYYLASKELDNNQFFLSDYCRFLISEGLYTEALKLLKEKSIHFNQYERLLFLGEIYFLINKLEESLKYYTNANLLIPNRLIPLDRLLSISIVMKNTKKINYYAKRIVKMPIKVDSEKTNNIQKRAQNILKPD